MCIEIVMGLFFAGSKIKDLFVNLAIKYYLFHLSFYTQFSLFMFTMYGCLNSKYRNSFETSFPEFKSRSLLGFVHSHICISV